MTYDPAYVYELATIVQDGIKQHVRAQRRPLLLHHDVHEDYVMPAMPEGVADGILRGLTACRRRRRTRRRFSCSAQVRFCVRRCARRTILAERYNIAADVWSVTSYVELRRDALEAERWNRLHPTEPERVPYLLQALGDAKGPIVAVSDYMKSVPDGLAPWLGQRLVTLGTDGFGRSDNREHLRSHFEISAESVVAATLSRLGA